MKHRVFALLLLLLAGPANAATPVPPALYDLYARGRYEDAIRTGEAANSAIGLAVASRAALSDALLRNAPCLDCLKRAEALARRAVALDPKLADAQVWLGTSLGLQARIIGLVRARLRGLPGQGAAAFAAAVAAEPDNVYAVVASGSWNIEVVKAGGPFLAQRLYGATVEKGLGQFDRAIALAHGNPAIRYQMALTLAGFDPVAHRARIRTELDAALRGTPATAYDRVLQQRAAQLKTAMGGSRVALDALVRKFQGYP